MDESKVQAMKIIDTAKRMIADRDYMGARCKLLEVQLRFPSLHKISKMITVCDILCAADLTLLDGQTDWYWVLQVGPAASSSQIISQHTKLSNILEGTKDDFPGAVAALELVREAFAVLSNMPTRLIFDSKRMNSLGVGEHLVSPASSFEKEEDCLPPDQICISNNTDSQKAVGSLDEAFDIIQLDKDVCLSSAKPTFLSLESVPKKEAQNRDDVEACTMDDDNISGSQRIGEFDFDFNGMRKPDVVAVGQIWAVYDVENLPRRYVRINNISQSPFKLDVTSLQPVPWNSDEIKWCEAGLPVVCGTFNLHVAEDSFVEHTSLSHLVSYTASSMYDQFEIYPKEHEVWAIYKDWYPFEWCENPESRRGCTLQIVEIIEGCLGKELMIVAELVKVDGFQNIYKREGKKGEEFSIKIPFRCMYRFSHRLPAYAFSGEMFELDPLAINASCQKLLTMKTNSLKLEWLSEDFASGQVWAIYNGLDRMPRQYVLVKNIVSGGEVRVAFLEPHPISDEEISWFEEKIPFGCGTFKISSTICSLQMDKFSHQVNCERSSNKMFYRVNPRKGEIWAMYTNWSRQWKQQDFEGYHCRIIEIMSDFSSNSGLLTASLEVVPGYNTFFKRKLSNGYMLNRIVPRSEMLSFSHRVEAFVVPGIEKYGIPGCSWHLEPDALPPLLAN